MNEIQMVDLKNQRQKIASELNAAFEKVLTEAAFINGPEVKNFAENLEKYTGINHVIPCANGTDALQIAFMALDLKPGDEIIIPAFTYVATAEAAALLGLKPVLVDVNPKTFNLDPEAISKVITPKTKAIVPVHLFGQCANMNAILKIAREHNLAVIEDAAQAIGAEFSGKNGTVQAGGIGTIGTTSFFPSKNLGCYGDGGALFTNSTDLAKKLQMIASHGQEKKYYHEIIGVNSRLDTLQAAILNVKLNYLNEYISARQKAAGFYDDAFKNCAELETPFRNPDSTHVFHQYTLKIKNGKRNELAHFLKQNGIPSMTYYPVPVHLQNAFTYLGYKNGDFPVSEALCEMVLSLPMHTELPEEQLQYITQTTLCFFS